MTDDAQERVDHLEKNDNQLLAAGVVYLYNLLKSLKMLDFKCCVITGSTSHLSIDGKCGLT